MASLKLPVALLAILTLMAFFADPLGALIGPLEYTGSLSYTYVEGDNPIVKVVFQFDDEIGKQLIVTNAPPQWSWMQGGNILSMSGGSLQPGDTLVVQISFREFVPPGEKPFQATGITSAGEESIALGVLVVSLMVLLQVLSILALNRFYLLAATIALGILGVLLGGKKEKPGDIELPVSPGPVTVDPGVKDGLSPPPVIQIDKGDTKCQCTHSWIHQYMDLDIEPRGTIKTLSDDPLPLKGTATDKHALIQTCTCPATGVVSNKVHLLEAGVRIEWEILSGEGGFINLNDDEGQKTVSGEQVLYQPPDIEDTEDEKVVSLKVTAYHNDYSKHPDHDPVEIYVDMKIKREITEDGESTESDREFTDPGDMKDEYVYSIEIRGEPVQGEDLPEAMEFDCIPYQNWQPGSEITGSVAHAPSDVAYGDHVRLMAVGTDSDVLELYCNPSHMDSHGCVTPSETQLVTLNDQLVYTWTAEKGTFPQGNVGREVIWQAPDVEGEVRIKVFIKDSWSQFDDDMKEDIRIINVHKLGLDLVKANPYWLPRAEDRLIEIPSRTYMCVDGKWVQPGRKKMIRAKLYKVSREPGVCMNYPQFGNKNPDLFFKEETNGNKFLFYRDKTERRKCPTEILVEGDNPAHDHHHLYAISKKRAEKLQLIIRSEDFGSVGYLVSEGNHCVPIPPLDDEDATYDDCREGPNDIKIPRDDNDNDITDTFLHDMGGADSGEDKDPRPEADGYPGDGLTNYEEYRGFLVGGTSYRVEMVGGKEDLVAHKNPRVHIRTDPRVKDVFIYNEYQDDISWVKGTKLKPHQLFDPNFLGGSGSLIVNYNHGRHHGGEQHGLWLTRDNTLKAMGMAVTKRASDGPGLPKTMSRITINYDKLIKRSSDSYKATVAHEICHGLNVWHHGQGDDHELSVDGYEVILNHQGGQASGDVECLMCYTNYAYGWCHGSWPSHHGHLTTTVYEKDGEVYTGAELHKQRPKLCTSNAPTGLNDWAPGHANPATKGDCMGQLRVKDW